MVSFFVIQRYFCEGMKMFEKVDPRENAVRQEHEVLKFWDDAEIFNKLAKRNEDGPRWSFLDGPITANNPMGVHHAWGRTYKDCFQRFHAMKGYKLRYQNGFDCQGLWVEVEVEKQLEFKTKRDIEKFGIEKFVNKCKERARKYADVQTEQSRRLGYWMDWDNSYYTMDDENNYMIWAFLKKCHDRSLIYKGADSMPWCPRCGTGISQHEMHEGYREVADTSVFLRLPIRGRTNEHLLVWTTTPWTLSANVACAVNANMKYVKVRQGKDSYYLAHALSDVMKEKGAFEIVAELTGTDMTGWSYDGPFDELPAQKKMVHEHKVVSWDDVSEAEGTGIVHVAPGCGKEDFDLAKMRGLPVLAPIDESGQYVDGYGFLCGRNAAEVSEDILRNLEEKSYFYKREEYVHSYPHCWRCDTPLLFRHVHEWFIDMSWRDEIKENVRKCKWIPEWGQARELDWLDNMRDWMISKKRYWGLALPIFECDCGWFDVVGARDELKNRTVEGWELFDGHSPHRPWIDRVEIACEKCGKKVSRIKDVGNPWLDAGIVPYSTVRYSTDRAYWKNWTPADLVLECFPGQFRNWFYALLSMSTMMENISPFKTLFGHALVRDEKGEEMHKSKANAIWFDDAAEKMGVDVMRWLFCRQDPTSNLNFGYGVGKEIERTVFNTWRNVYAFFCNYARLDEFDVSRRQIPVAQRPDMDRWIVSDLNLFLKRTNESMAEYDVASMAHGTEELIDRLSNWYVRRNRRRFWRAKSDTDTDKLAAYQTLHEVLVTLCRALAPVVPFMTELMYQNLVHNQDPSAPESVHLCSFPEAEESAIDETLSKDMDAAADLVSAVLSLRQASKIRVRQPLPSVTVVCRREGKINALKRFEAHILDETNVKRLSCLGQEPSPCPKDDIVVHEGRDMTVMLDTSLSDELVAEGIARDVVRRVQMLRKEEDLEMDDRIELHYATESQQIKDAVEEWSDYIRSETLADEIQQGTSDKPGKLVRLGDQQIALAIVKV